MRKVLAVLVCLLAAESIGNAQEWANKMFNVTSHDFGTVARGAKAEFRFQIKNIYQEDAHIAGVRSSCGCMTPQITRSDLKTFQTAEIVAELNTRDFLGQKSPTLFVTFDQPFHAVVELHVTGFIRGDVVLQPGAIDLGTVDVGTEIEKKLQVIYAGREDWKIVDAKTADPNFEVEVTELGRGAGKVSYELLIRLTKTAPVGYIKDQLILVTNDARARELPVDMSGRVISEITISPTSLFMGTVHPGQTVTKKLLVRGKKPFKIIDVKCPDKSFEIETSKEAKSVHVIPVVFTAGDDPGKVARKISIMTDQGDNLAQAFTAYALVVKADGSGKANDTPAHKAETSGE
ncbi:MAG: DUF1573 domain-containing protein [Planctomycetia bacterium]|nr:DUF1573 domain-containing protein [Planctomycetia bacterium]